METSLISNVAALFLAVTYRAHIHKMIKCPKYQHHQQKEKYINTCSGRVSLCYSMQMLEDFVCKLFTAIAN